MKVNDLAIWHGQAVLITELYESKVWRTGERGKEVNFGEIDTEPFARIFVNGMYHGVPLVELKPINEAR